MTLSELQNNGFGFENIFYMEGIKQDLYILENKVIDNFSAQYMQLMGYLNPNFSAGITLSINKEKGWEEAYDYIVDKLTVMKNTEKNLHLYL